MKKFICNKIYNLVYMSIIDTVTEYIFMTFYNLEY